MDTLGSILTAIGAFLLLVLHLAYTGASKLILIFYGTTYGHEVLVSLAANAFLLVVAALLVYWQHIRGLWRNEDRENIEISFNYLAADNFFRIVELSVVLPIKTVFPNSFVRRRFYKAMNKANTKPGSGDLLNYGSDQSARIIRKAMRTAITQHFGAGYLAEAARLPVTTVDCLFAANFERHTGPDAPVSMPRLVCVTKGLALNTPTPDDATIKVSKEEYRQRLVTINAIGHRYESLRQADAEAAKKGKKSQNAAYMEVRLVQKT